MERLVFVVSVYRPDQYQHARDVFGVLGDLVEVVLDRRVGERRNPTRAPDATPERRQDGDRRQQHLDERLRTAGWAVARGLAPGDAARPHPAGTAL